MLNIFDQRCQPAAVLCRFRGGMLLVLAVKFKYKFISIGSGEKNTLFRIDLECHMDLVVYLIKGTQIGDGKDTAAVKAKLL